MLEAESTLCVRFPSSYRAFLRDFGCGDVNSYELYGLINSNFASNGIPDAVWCTLDDRRSFGLPTHFISIATDPDGFRVCLDLSELTSENEAPVVLVAFDNGVVETLAPTFGAFLLDLLDRQTT